MVNKDSNELVIFLHVPKTAGTSLGQIICKQYPQNVFYDVTKNNIFPKGVEAIKDQVEKTDCLFGHFLFGVHKYVSRPATYITMLRNPVEQVLSNFFSSLKHPDHPNYSIFKDLSLEEYLDSEHVFLNENMQTTFISGQITPDFDKAKHHLDNNFSIVGITEQFSESVFLMYKNLNWTWEKIVCNKLNVNERRPLQESIDRRLISKIIEKNESDIKLYNYAKDKLEQKIKLLSIEERRLLNTL
jgi:hypothetical protein